MAESHPEEAGFEEIMVSPEFENYSQTEGVTIEPSISTQSEWKLAYAEENLLIETPSALAKPETASNELEDLDIIIPIELQNETVVDNVQINVSPIPGGTARTM